jgi:hypothetical protein
VENDHDDDSHSSFERSPRKQERSNKKITPEVINPLPQEVIRKDRSPSPKIPTTKSSSHNPSSSNTLPKYRRKKMIVSDDEENEDPMCDLNKTLNDSFIDLNQDQPQQQQTTEDEDIKTEDQSLDLNVELEDLDLNMNLEEIEDNLEMAYEPPSEDKKSPIYHIVQYVVSPSKEVPDFDNNDTDILNITISPTTFKHRENILKRLKKKRESFCTPSASLKTQETLVQKLRRISIRDDDSEDRKSSQDEPLEPQLGQKKN